MTFDEDTNYNNYLRINYDNRDFMEEKSLWRKKKMKTTDFKYKTPESCIIRGCLNPICWVSEDEDIGLCNKHYAELIELKGEQK